MLYLQQIKAKPNIQYGPYYSRLVDTVGFPPSKKSFLCELQSTLRVAFPKINSMPQPIIRVSAETKIVQSIDELIGN